MFFVFIFLILATLVAYVFPEWSWVMVLGLSFASVAALRLMLSFAGQKAGASPRNDLS